MVAEPGTRTSQRTSTSSLLDAPLRLPVYLLPFVAPPILLLILALAVAPSRWLSERIRDPFLDDIGYGATLRHIDCQLVIYGDSSAEVGLDAVALEKHTGLSTCNLAEPESMTTINGTAVLDQYLTQNKPPRYIVFFFAPEHFSPHLRDGSVGAFEAITYTMRERGRFMGMASMWRDPALFFTWASFGDNIAAHVLAATLLDKLKLRSIPTLYEKHSRQKRQGTLSIGEFETADCQTLPRPQSPDENWVKSLREKYSNASTTVLVDAMAIPACDPGLLYDREHLNGVIDNDLATMPVTTFAKLTRHVNAEGAKEVTARLAQQITANPLSSTDLEAK